MDESIALLDTPKKASLQSRASTLRAALKDFERTFATDHNGRKPSKDDIKANADLAGQYKEYNRVRDILAGRLGLVALPNFSPSKRKRPHSRSESAHIASPTKQRLQSTPSAKRLRPDDIDPYDAPSSVTPRRVLSAIGPTPQRDGQALGIFDLMSNPGSGRSFQATPASRKRKIEALLGDDEDVENQPIVAQTPSQRPSKKGDLLDHLTGTPASQSRTPHNKHSRTPVSDGKKFMLSQFFATPSAVRYANMSEPLVEPTPLRNRILGRSPSKADSTPAYLRRSYSFKDRLLSASSNPSRDNSSDVDPGSPSSVRIAPRRRTSGKQVKFMPKPLSQIAAEMREKEDEMHDDDLDAMRDMENKEAGVLVGESQPASKGNNQNQSQPEQAPGKVWKKRGQKRTTKRVIMRPSRLNAIDSQKPSTRKSKDAGEKQQQTQKEDSEAEISHDDEDNDDFIDERSEDELHQTPKPSTSSRPSQPEKTKTSRETTAKAKASKDKPKEKGTTINPNAVSHMNFRSLKIKNKNSKAKRGRGRFGRR